MSGPLTGRTVALAEGRQLEELIRLLEAEGASCLRCPLLGILDAPDAGAVEAWLRDLIAGHFALVILMTGEAVRRLAGFAERAGLRDDYVAALGRTRLLARGPKPVQALRELGLPGAPVSKAPTTDGVIATFQGEDLSGRTVGLTLYGNANPALEGFLARAGASVRPVLSYVYAPAADDDRVADLIDRLEAGGVDALVFTSSPQVERLYAVAARRDLGLTLAAGLARTCVAAVGPVVADALREHGSP